MLQPEQAEPVLQLSALSAGYKSVPTIRDIDILLQPGDTIAVIGANGAGKTTLLRAIMGQISAMSGEVRFLGRPVTALSTASRARLGIGYAPEGRQLFPAMSVVENLEVGAARVSSRERSHRIAQMLEIFPKLKMRSKSDCGLLSGGEQQMVAIARALMSQPRVLLLDEPSTGLAPRVISELYASLSTLLPSGITILVAEQNARAALKFTSRGIVLEEGRAVTSGRASDLMADPRVVDAYVGLGAHDLSWSSKACDVA